jgi:CTP:molybdopterin cytidylyltransferase MocA
MTGEAIGAVLLAAGCASRYGAPKQLIPVAGIPMARRAAQTAMQCTARTVVVTGAYRTEVECCLGDLDIELAFNSAWRRGMGGSIACGVERLLRLDPGTGACLVMLADQPLVTVADLASLIDAHRHHRHRIIASGYDGGTRGAPCLFPRRNLEELLSLQGPGGARSVLRAHPDEVHSVANPHACIDIDTPEDSRQLPSDIATGCTPSIDSAHHARRQPAMRSVTTPTTRGFWHRNRP